MAVEFKKIIKDYSVSQKMKVSPISRKNWNVLRLHQAEDTYIAKGIIHVVGDDEMGASQMDKAFKNEVEIISALPAWWGLTLKDKFATGRFRVVITREIPHCKWAEYGGQFDKVLAKALHRQLGWLHRHRMAHNDLELKNILLACDHSHATIIDFEKATRNATAAQKREDYRLLLATLRENENTAGIGAHLEMLKRKTRRVQR